MRAALALLLFNTLAVAASWSPPDAEALPDHAWGRAVRLGRDLTTATPRLIGSEVSDPSHRFAGNDLTCQNCHLHAGTAEFALPFVGVLPISRIMAREKVASVLSRTALTAA